jgi:hypothetical protein
MEALFVSLSLAAGGLPAVQAGANAQLSRAAVVVLKNVLISAQPTQEAS